MLTHSVRRAVLWGDTNHAATWPAVFFQQHTGSVHPVAFFGRSSPRANSLAMHTCVLPPRSLHQRVPAHTVSDVTQ